MISTADKISKNYTKALGVMDDSQTWYERYGNVGTTLAWDLVGAGVGIPNTVLKPIRGKEMFGYPRVYGDTKQTKTAFYNDLLDYRSTPEARWKKVFEEKREKVKGSFKTNFESEYERLTTEKGLEFDSEKRDELYNKYKNKFYKDNNLEGGKKVKYEDKMQELDWDKIQEKADGFVLPSLEAPKTETKKKKKPAKRKMNF